MEYLFISAKASTSNKTLPLALNTPPEALESPGAKRRKKRQVLDTVQYLLCNFGTCRLPPLWFELPGLRAGDSLVPAEGLCVLSGLRGRSLKIFGAWPTVPAGQLLRKEVMPMVQFLLDVLAGFLAAVLAALFNRHMGD